MKSWRFIDDLVFGACLLLAIAFFTLDLTISYEYVCPIAYIGILFVVFCSSRRAHIYFFAALLSILTVIGYHFSFSRDMVFHAVFNRGLTIFTMWVVAILGSKYKKRKEWELYLAAIVDSTEEAILGKTLKGQIAYWNKGAEKLYGYSAKEMIGRPVHVFVPPEKTGELAEIFNLIRHGHQIKDFETDRITKDGRIITVALTISPIRDDRGKVIGAATVVRDLTAIKKRQTELRQEKEAVETVVRQKFEELKGAQKELKDGKRLYDIGTLAATVAHELRNPLGVIRTAAYNIKRKSRDPALESHIANIERKVLASEQIINNLLEYAHIKMPQYQDIDVNELINESIRSVRRRFYDRPVRIVRGDLEHEPIRIQADPVQLGEVIDNILNNSFQAIKGDDGVIGIILRRDEANRFLEIIVQDNGEGIDTKDMNNVFKPFFTTKSKGTGLGLALCHEMIGLHKGELALESERGLGTKITIRLPMQTETAHVG